MKFCKSSEIKSWKSKHYLCSDYVLNCVTIHLLFFPGFILAKTSVCPRSSTLPEKDRTVLQGPGQQSCYNRCWFLEWDVSPQFGEFNYMLKDKIFSETNVMASFNTIVSSYITPLDNWFAGIFYALNYPLPTFVSDDNLNHRFCTSFSKATRLVMKN